MSDDEGSLTTSSIPPVQKQSHEEEENKETTTTSSERKVRGRGAQGKESSLGYEKGKGTPVKSIEGWIVFASGIHEEAQEEDVHDLFAEHGEIKNLSLNLDRLTGLVAGYAMVEYKTREEAQVAIDALNGKDFREKTLTVDWAFIDTPEHLKTGPGSYSKFSRGRDSDYGKDKRRKRSPSPATSRKKERV